MKLLSKIFNFGAKYRKQEADYHDESKRSGAVGHLITLILTAAIPLLGLWGAFQLPWGDTAISLLKVLCIVACISITTVPSDLMILGIVALRHRARMKIQNKVENVVIAGVAETITGQEMTDEDKQKLQERPAKGTDHKMDLTVGILGIVMSVLVVVAFVALLLLFVQLKTQGAQ